MRHRTKLAIALAFFVAALIHSTIWGSITPLWQIPDEPAHYEYLRLMVKLGRLPHKGDEDPVVQADLLRSMWQNHYWEYLGFRRPDQPPTRILAGGWTAGGDIPDTAVVGDAYIYAFSNLTNSQPFYYLMLAPVQWAVITQPIDTQLLALRAASRVIFALAVLFITLTAAELFDNNPVLMIGAGVIAVLQPMFVYIGSGLNNDVGVTLLIAVLTWQIVLGWRRGYNWWRIGLIILTTVVAVYTKRTAIFAVAWVPFVIAAWWLSRVERRKVIRFALIVTGVTVGIGLLAGLSYLIPGKSPANWNNSDPGCQAWTNEFSHSGSRAFMVQGGCVPSHTLTVSMRRPIGVGDNRPATLSVWVMSQQPGNGILRIQDDGGNSNAAVIHSGEDWQLASITLTITSNTSVLIFSISGLSTTPIYVDDISVIILNASPLTLSVPNASAENVTPVLGDILLGTGKILGVYGQVNRAIQDYRANLSALPARLRTALSFVSSSYWGKFGIFARAPNPGVPEGLGVMLNIIVAISFISAIIHIIAIKPINICRLLISLFLFGLSLLVLQTFAPLFSFAAGGLWLPQGRYLFGGMGLIVCIWTYGLFTIFPRRWWWGILVGITILMLVLTVVAAQMTLSFFSFIA